MVPAEGLEPPLPYGKQILSLSRLPFRHAGGDKVRVVPAAVPGVKPVPPSARWIEKLLGRDWGDFEYEYEPIGTRDANPRVSQQVRDAPVPRFILRVLRGFA